MAALDGIACSPVLFDGFVQRVSQPQLKVEAAG